jgi:hypothetical protein
MTLTDYMNLEKFPATSQKGLSPEKQLRIDAFNYDQLEEAIARGHQMDAEQIQVRAELQTKRPWMAELTRQIAAAKKIDKKPEMAPPPMINTDMDEEFLSEAGEDCESFASLFGNAIMTITNDAGLSSADKRKKVLGALKLMEEDDEEPIEEADELATDFATYLGNAIMSIIYNAGLSTADKRKKVLGALKLMDDDDDDEIPGMPPPQTIYTDMNLAAPTEAFDQASLDRLPASDRPFVKLSKEEFKTMCEQVVKILKVTKEQEKRDKQTYREIYGEEMPEM